MAPAERATADRVVSPTEAALAEIWSQVLRRPSIGPDEDFFRLGGTSLKATLIAAQVRQRLGAALPLSTIFECRTIAACATALDADPGAATG